MGHNQCFYNVLHGDIAEVTTTTDGIGGEQPWCEGWELNYCKVLVYEAFNQPGELTIL